MQNVILSGLINLKKKILGYNGYCVACRSEVTAGTIRIACFWSACQV
jgi:hypothetical protein